MSFTCSSFSFVITLSKIEINQVMSSADETYRILWLISLVSKAVVSSNSCCIWRIKFCRKMCTWQEGFLLVQLDRDWPDISVKLARFSVIKKGMVFENVETFSNSSITAGTFKMDETGDNGLIRSPINL